MSEKIQSWWLSLSDTTRSHIISSTKVFLAAFIVPVLIALKQGHIEWSVAFLSSLVTAGLNSGIKALIENYAPPSLGGIRKQNDII